MDDSEVSFWKVKETELADDIDLERLELNHGNESRLIHSAPTHSRFLKSACRVESKLFVT